MGTYEAMRGVTAFFGEDWDEGDPSRVLRIVRDFVNLFDKSMAEIEVRCPLRVDGTTQEGYCMLKRDFSPGAKSSTACTHAMHAVRAGSLR